MSEREHEPFSIPPHWDDARPYLERVLEERRTRLDRRDDAIEAQILDLTKRVEDTQMDMHSLRDSQTSMAAEVHSIGDGMRHLNESFRDVADRYSSHHQFLQIHEQKQADRDERQKRIDENLELILHIEQREDRARYGWRLSILILMLISVVLWAVDKIHIGG